MKHRSIGMALTVTVLLFALAFAIAVLASTCSHTIKPATRTGLAEVMEELS